MEDRQGSRFGRWAVRLGAVPLAFFGLMMGFMELWLVMGKDPNVSPGLIFAIGLVQLGLPCGLVALVLAGMAFRRKEKGRWVALVVALAGIGAVICFWGMLKARGVL